MTNESQPAAELGHESTRPRGTAMPMNSAQLAALVDRARQKAPPVVISLPLPSRPMRGHQTAAPTPTPPATARTVPSPPRPSSTPQPETANEPENFPTGWVLGRESWRFHRRFYAVFRRPMRPREYSYLLHQIPNRAEHLGNDCWARCLTATVRCPSAPAVGGSSPSCRRTGSRREAAPMLPSSKQMFRTQHFGQPIAQSR